MSCGKSCFRWLSSNALDALPWTEWVCDKASELEAKLYNSVRETLLGHLKQFYLRELLIQDEWNLRVGLVDKLIGLLSLDDIERNSN